MVAGIWLFLTLGVACTVPGEAQAFDDFGLAAQSATAVVAARQPFAVAMQLLLCQKTHVFDAPEKRPEEGPESVLAERDKLVGIEDGAPVRGFDENFNEALSYTYLLVWAHNRSPVALARKARADLTYVHLIEESSKYRGALVHVEGRMRRLTRFDAPRLAAKDGVATLYEAWVFGEHSPSNPFCLIASEIPPGVKTGEKIDDKVVFDAYFFKRYRYKAGDGWREAPLLIGCGFELLEAEPPSAATPTEEFGGMFIPILLVLLAGTVVLAAALAWWFRRGDRTVHTKLHEFRPSEFINSPADELPTPGDDDFLQN
jgi:hypothetical protein